MSRTKTAGLIGLLIVGLVGCNGSQSIVTPDNEQGLSDASFNSALCPPVGEMCQIIAQEVLSVCPNEGFRNRGQLNSCRRHELDEHMKLLPDCYSGSQRLAMKKCIMEAVGLIDYYDEPGDYTDPKVDPHIN